MPQYKCPNQQSHCHVLAGGFFSDIPRVASKLPRPASRVMSGRHHARVAGMSPAARFPPSFISMRLHSYLHIQNTYPTWVREKISHGNFSDLALVCASSSQVLHIKAIRERSSEHVRVFCNPTLFIFLVEPSVEISKLTCAYWFQEKTVLCHNGSHRTAHLRRIL